MPRASQPRRRHVESVLGRALRSQHGAVRRDQLLAAGLTTGDIDDLLAIGRIRARHLGVYVDRGAPTPERETTAAVLATEALVSHTSAAALLGFGVPLPLEPHVSTGRTVSARLDGVVVHRPLDLDRSRRHRAGGFWVTDAHRTALDLGAVVGSDDRYFDLLARAKGRRLVSIPGLWFTLNAHARRGRTGVGRLRRYLAEPSVTLPTPDVLEARLARVLVAAGVGRIEVERVLTADGQFLGRVDALLADHDQPVEADGWEVHGTPSGLEYDLARQNRLVLAGRAPLRYSWRQVFETPSAIQRDVRAAIGRAA